MRKIEEIQADWDFVEQEVDPELELVQAQQRLFKDLPGLLKEIRRQDRIIRMLTEDGDAD